MVAVDSSANRTLSPQKGVDCGTNPTGLFKLIEEENWDEVVALCKKSPILARTWGYRKGGDEDPKWRRLPLHEACIRRPTKQVVEALLEAYPLGVQAKDHYGRLALHHACFYAASTEVVHTLLLASPEAIDAQDSWGKTPLSIARSTSSPHKDGVVEAIRKGRSYWLVKLEEKKWIRDRDDQIASLRNIFKEERSAYQARIGDVEKRATEERRKLNIKIAELEDENTSLQEEIVSLSEKTLSRSEEEVTLHSKLEEATAKLAEDAKARGNLEEQLADAYLKLENYAMERENRSGAKGSLESQVRTLKLKLEDAEAAKYAYQSEIQALNHKVTSDIGNYNHLEEEIEAEKARATELKKHLEEAMASKRELEAMMESLQEKLAHSASSTAEGTLSHMEERKKMEEESNELTLQLVALKQEKEELEAKAKKDEETINKMKQDSEAYYQQSTESIAELERKILTLSQECETLTSSRQEHEEKLIHRIHTLESRLKSLSGERSSDFKNTKDSFKIIERQLAAAAEEHKRVMNAVSMQKGRRPLKLSDYMQEPTVRPKGRRTAHYDDYSEGRSPVSAELDEYDEERSPVPTYRGRDLDLEERASRRSSIPGLRRYLREEETSPAFLKMERHAKEMGHRSPYLNYY